MTEILFSFIDLPYLQFDRTELLSVFDAYAQPLYSLSQTNKPEGTKVAYWKGMTVYSSQTPSTNDGTNLGSDVFEFTNHYDVFNEKFPFFYEYMKLLPFDSLSRIQLWENILPVPFHKDVNLPPTEVDYNFRIMLLHDSPKPTFIMRKGDERFEPTWNQTSNVFVYNNKSAEHGSLLQPGRKILTVINGHFNIDKCLELVNTSAKKYKDYAWVIQLVE